MNNNRPWREVNTLYKVREHKIRLKEGTWDLPKTNSDFENLKHFFDDPVPAYLWPLRFKDFNPFELISIGDDVLYDDLDSLSNESRGSDARPLVLKNVERFRDYAEESGRKDAENWKEVVEYAQKKLKEKN